MLTISQMSQTIADLQGRIDDLRGQINLAIAEPGRVDFASVLSDQEAGPQNEDLNLTEDNMSAPSVAAVELPASLLVDTEEQSLANKPGLREFMEVTGADHMVGTELLYGVIGSNGDFRDWEKIMSSADPLTAARRATAALYSSGKDYELRNDETFGTLDYIRALDAKTVATDNRINRGLNFDNVTFENGAEREVLLSSKNLMLRSVSASQNEIDRVRWLFGLDA